MSFLITAIEHWQKLLQKKWPKTFTAEQARSAIRYRRGATGDKLRAGAGIKEIQKVERQTPFPKSKAKPRKPVVLPDGKTLILSDIHMPYQDSEACEVAMRFAVDYRPNTIYLNGDTIDFFAISRWERDPEKRDLSGELQAGRQFLKHLRELFPDALIYWKNGNHEDRWEHYLWNKAPELCGVSDFELKNILRFSEYGVQFVHSKQVAKIGKHLTILHGHEIMASHDPVNFARTLFMKLMCCCMAGHKHKTSSYG